MRKALVLSYEEEHVVVDALIMQRIALESELAMWERTSLDCNVSTERRICASNLEKGVREKLHVLCGVIAMMSSIPYELEDDER